MEKNPSLVWNDFLYRTALEPSVDVRAFIRVETYKLSPVYEEQVRYDENGDDKISNRSLRKKGGD